MVIHKETHEKHIMSHLTELQIICNRTYNPIGFTFGHNIAIAHVGGQNLNTHKTHKNPMFKWKVGFQMGFNHIRKPHRVCALIFNRNHAWHMSMTLYVVAISDHWYQHITYCNRNIQWTVLTDICITNPNHSSNIYRRCQSPTPFISITSCNGPLYRGSDIACRPSSDAICQRSLIKGPYSLWSNSSLGTFPMQHFLKECIFSIKSHL